MTEAETRSMRGILGAMLLDENALVIALSELRPDAMVGQEAVVLKAVRAMAERQERVDMILVCAELERTGSLDAAGGPALISALCEYAVPLTHLEAHCLLVNGEAIRRALRRACLTAIAEADEGENTGPDVLDAAEARLLGVRDHAGAPDFEPIGTILARVLAGACQGISTGFRIYDWATGGLQNKQLVVLASRPGVGKTSIGTQMAAYIARAGVATVFFSLEMDTTEIASRLVAQEGRLPLKQVENGGLEVEAAVRQIAQLPLTVVHVPRPTLIDLKATIRRVQTKIGLIVVDYLQLVHSGRRFEQRSLEVDAIARGLKQLAGELDLPVLALAQLNRNTEGGGKPRRPVLSDLRESGGIEMHADVVAFLHRQKYYDPEDREAELIVAKNRQGPLAGAKLTFNAECVRFENERRDST